MPKPPIETYTAARTVTPRESWAICIPLECMPAYMFRDKRKTHGAGPRESDRQEEKPTGPLYTNHGYKF